ncbi:Stp1/IreP family PP2C-type Ser/Thr phosphatase [Ligilactobacillus acidipiscis]|uniref:protein-serine/threonine phosphatase n=1 Tax=Ligilactobacillus acidipiscis TaxID=89059 RepID=A0A0R2K279_9LACO|nr:Stp1/IreP family PP2C-type Ser/Thr phosphatase [Ligilactobacillus acidipiscis]KRN83737.1 serine threonine specific protein phosphatase [Ligilactobacillus acidipiscis]SFV40445.1 Protein serine/threonine phosphatase PrpC, regulation of stationary phase [Ligilactobacillus acidipiscis]
MKYSYLSDVGRSRQKNEDFVGFFTNQVGVSLAIVADGLGGHQGGEVASEMAVSNIGYEFEQTSFEMPNDAYSWLQKQAVSENKKILHSADQNDSLMGMGTTLVCVVILKKRLLISNIGDSRCYLFNEGRLTQLTEDHSLVNEMVKNGQISKEQARIHPQKNIITRTLGVSKDARLDQKLCEIVPGKLLLCTDGLTNMVEDEQIAAILGQKKLSLKEKCQQLIKAANQAGGADNITALLISFENKEVS